MLKHRPFVALVTGILLMLPVSSILAADASVGVDELQGVTDPPHGDSVRSASPVREVIVVFKTHFDIGYTDMASKITDRYRTTFMDGALDVVDQSQGLPPERQFAWTIPGWPMHKMLQDWPGQTPERQQRIRRAVRDGRFVVHALPFTTHTELLEPEDLVHGLSYASDLSRQSGLELPRDAKMTDVPCHSWILPTLLRHAGVTFLHLGCNAASSSPQVPRLFWWIGPDGSRVLTMYTAESYGTGLVPPADWPYRTWLALIHTGDNQGPPTPAEVAAIFQQAQQKLPGVRVRIGRLADFADAILAENAALPEIRGDMPDTWIHGPLCDPAGARTARQVRPLITATGALATTLQLWGVTSPASDTALAQARELSLLYGEHTWGGSLAWVTSYSRQTPFWYGNAFREERAAGRFARLEASWDEHSGYIAQAQRLLEPALDATLRSLADAVQTAGERIVVYNPLPWPRDGLVEVRGGDKSLALRAVDSDQVTAAWSEGGAGAVRFIARDVPAMGYRTYVPCTADTPPSQHSADSATRTIETPYFRAVLDPARGAIASLCELQTGRELVDPSAAYGFGQYLYERFDADQVAAYVRDYVKIDSDWALAELGKPDLPSAREVPYRAACPSDCTLKLETCGGAVTAVMESRPSASLPHAVTTRLTLYSALPYADLEVTVHDKAADPWPEAGWICLPLAIPQPQFRLGRLGGIVDPTRDIVPGTNRDLGAMHTGLAVFEPGGQGVGLCALDSPLVSLDRPGLWKYSREFTPKRPVVFVNLFNNQWSTNFRLWNSGTWTSRVRLWSLQAYAARHADHTVARGAAAAAGVRGARTRRCVAADSPRPCASRATASRSCVSRPIRTGTACCCSCGKWPARQVR